MKLLLIGIMLAMFFGCVSSHGKRFSTLVPDMYSAEIERLNIAIASKQKANIADVHLQLALLYSSYNNPKRDYSKALKEIKKYIALEPKRTRDFEVQNLFNMLKSIRIRRQNKLVKELTLENETLSEEIKQLNETIDKLKQLDVELEKKRKTFK